MNVTQMIFVNLKVALQHYKELWYISLKHHKSVSADTKSQMATKTDM
jgi:hypothetical protein